MKEFGFGKHQHLRKNADFARVFARRCVVRNPRFLLFAATSESGHSRIGLSVSKRHGNAVIRNRIKRLFREAFRLSQLQFSGGIDLVVVPQDCRNAPLCELAPALVHAVEKVARRLAREEKDRGKTVSESPVDSGNLNA